MAGFQVEYDNHGFEQHSDRMQIIENLNHDSFLMHEESPLQVVQSLHSAGARRDALTAEYAPDLSPDVVSRAATIGRETLAGNISPLGPYGPRVMTEEERVAEANQNLEAFLAQIEVNPEYIRMLRPERDYETPLTMVNVDEEPTTPDDSGLARPDLSGDFMYTFNLDTVLAARPADCPIVFISGETPKGEVAVLMHLAWLGVAHGYIDQAKTALDTLGVDWDTVRAQITPGGQARSFKFENFNKYDPREKFPDSESMSVEYESIPVLDEQKNPVLDKEGNLQKVYNFAIDLAPEVYEQIVKKWGINEYQVFLDTSDTTSPTSGYSSHSRSYKGYAVHGDNSRDIVLAKRRH